MQNKNIKTKFVFGNEADRRRFFGDQSCPFTLGCDGYNGFLNGKKRSAIGVALDPITKQFTGFIHCFVCGKNGNVLSNPYPNPNSPAQAKETANNAEIEQEVKYVDPKVMQASTNPKFYANNNFAQYCIKIAQELGKSESEAIKVLQAFNVGTTKEGDAVFWLVDAYNNIRTARITRYNSNGKRSRDPFAPVGRPPLQYRTDSGYKQCCFNEHLLLKYPNYAICVLESEKSVILASMYYYWILKQKVIFIASNGIHGRKPPVECLKNRTVSYLPDVGVNLESLNPTIQYLENHGVKAYITEPIAFFSRSPFNIPVEAITNGFDFADAVDWLVNNQRQTQPNACRLTNAIRQLKNAGFKPEIDLSAETSYFFTGAKTANELVDFFIQSFNFTVVDAGKIIDQLVTKGEIEYSAKTNCYYHRDYVPF